MATRVTPNATNETVEIASKDIGYMNGERRPVVEEGGVKIITANTTLTSEDHGKTIICNAADLVVTLPATAAGLRFKILTAVASASTGTSVSPAAADQIIGNGFTAADDKDAINTGASDVVGDLLEVTGDGSAGWYITDIVGTWAREA